MLYFLLKNVKSNIIKIILGHLPIATQMLLKEWKTAITLVGKEYKSTEDRQDYKIRNYLWRSRIAHRYWKS